jgi:hypothetical protein
MAGGGIGGDVSFQRTGVKRKTEVQRDGEKASSLRDGSAFSFERSIRGSREDVHIV